MRYIRTILVVVGLIIPTALLFAQTAPKPAPMGQGMMSPDCKAMMQRQSDMQAKMKAMDDRLDKLVADMDAARGSKKVDKMAAVIDELVAQRKQMRDSMQSMMPAMMQHMMQHMQSGMMQGMAESMANCPMMQKPAEGHEHAH